MSVVPLTLAITVDERPTLTLIERSTPLAPDLIVDCSKPLAIGRTTFRRSCVKRCLIRKSAASLLAVYTSTGSFLSNAGGHTTPTTLAISARN